MAKTDDEEIMTKHRDRIIKRKKDTKQKTMSEEDMRQTLDLIFVDYDLDGDNNLNMHEFMTMMNMISQRKNGVGGKRFTLEEIKKIMNKVDTDGDVSLDKQ